MSKRSNSNVRSFSTTKKVRDILADQPNKSSFINACIEYVFDSGRDISPWIDPIEDGARYKRYGKDFKRVKPLSALDRLRKRGEDSND